MNDIYLKKDCCSAKRRFQPFLWCKTIILAKKKPKGYSVKILG